MTASRYFLAWLAATAASIMVLIVGALVSGKIIAAFPAHFDRLGTTLPVLSFIAAGFIGGLVGSLCLQRSSRFFGSMLLTALIPLTATGILALALAYKWASFGPAGFKPLYMMDLSLAAGASINILLHKWLMRFPRMKPIQRLLIIGAMLAGTFANAQEPAREIRYSPDKGSYVGWFDYDAGAPIGLVRAVVVRNATSNYDWFSFVSAPRHTEAAWNSISTKCVVMDQPDNGTLNVWLVTRKGPDSIYVGEHAYSPPDDWIPQKLNFMTILDAQFRKTDPRVSRLFRPRMDKIEWLSTTTVRFNVGCNVNDPQISFSGEYFVTVDTAKPEEPSITRVPDQ